MKVCELIAILNTMPAEAKVLHLWDGEARTEIQHVWLSKSGKVITADTGMVCYSTPDRPLGAPTSGEEIYWRTPETGQLVLLTKSNVP